MQGARFIIRAPFFIPGNLNLNRESVRIYFVTKLLGGLVND